MTTTMLCNQTSETAWKPMVAAMILFLLAMLAPALAGAQLSPMTEDELSDVHGQALFQTEKIIGTGTQATGTSGMNFYRVGLDAELDLNLNIENLELGRTGGTAGTYNPANPQVDLFAENVAFGCVADAGGNCVDSQSGLGTQLKPVTLTRPYFEFAVKNDGSASREIVGIRLGGENIQGPLSFGLMKVFSGYLNATAQLTLEGMTDAAATCGVDAIGIAGPGGSVTPPYGPGCGGSYGGGLGGVGVSEFSGTWNTTNTNIITSNATQFQYTTTHLLSGAYNGTRGSLGLDNEEVCATVLITLCAQLAQTTATFDGATSSVLDAEANGMRLTQALVMDAGLATLVDAAVNTLTIEQCNADALVCFGAAILPQLVRGSAADAFKGQICDGLSISPCTDANLNNADLPYNLTNFHQVDVNSNNLGLSFQKENVRYPGYVPAATMGAGWTLYLPDAFFLSVSEPAGVFTNNIKSGAAGQGDLVGLDPVYDNCWGAATFC